MILRWRNNRKRLCQTTWQRIALSQFRRHKTVMRAFSMLKFKRNVNMEHSTLAGPDAAAEHQVVACRVAWFDLDDRQPVDAVT